MYRKFVNYRYLAAHRASSFPVLYTQISRILSGRDCYTNAKTDIVIDGFPRCANTYATYAFKIAQTENINIAHHIHKQSQFLQAAKKNIPSVLLIRNPVDCISSLLIRQPLYEPGTLFKGYFYLYNGLKDLDSFVAGDFLQILNNYGSIIRKVNEKFGSNFNEYKKTEENEMRVKEIIQTQDELIGAKDYRQRVAYPDSQRNQSTSELKEKLQSKKFSDLNKKCLEVYEYITQHKQ